MLENWGQMTKTQDNPQTINQAIDAAILAHEEDPESHMGAGESIENHRINEILDHKAGSVLADKWTMSEFEYTTTFENLAAFAVVGDVDNIWPGVGIFSHGSATPHLSQLILDLESALIGFDTSQESLIQLVIYGDNYSSDLAAFKFGLGAGTTYLNGMGLEIVGSTARFFAGNSIGSSVNYLSWPTYAPNTDIVVRLHNVPSEGVVKVYVNGELLGTIQWPEQYSDAGRIEMRSYSTAGYGSALYVRSLYFMQKPL